jgi:hypothetical protein
MAITIGISQVKATIRYINTQKQHHAKIRFADELKLFLKKHGLVEVPD